MSNRDLDYERQLQAITDALSESVAEATDAEILAETREEGQEPESVANRVRNFLLSTSKTFLQREMTESRKQYERDVAALQGRRYTLPATAQERRSLLAWVFQQKPEFLTAQWRDFENLTDEDVESCLKQMQELGILDDIDRSGRETR